MRFKTFKVMILIDQWIHLDLGFRGSDLFELRFTLLGFDLLSFCLQIVETGPPREPRTDASWNELELKSRELIAVGSRAG